MVEMFPPPKTDSDPQETIEWMDSLDSVLEASGAARTRYIVRKLIERAQMLRIGVPALVQTPYINTIPTDQEPEFPGDEQMERRIRRLIRWNAVAMVVRANKLFVGLGGHLSTYASAASLYEVGFNHFFRGKDGEGSGDHIFFQGHAAPGIYARSFLEGGFTEEQLDHFRREVVPAQGLSSYPHPRLMPDYWEFPTVSMGLGPINAIYQARFNRYLEHRGICDTSQSRVWCYLGDGETDEPESLGSLSIAAREKLDNLIFVVNCNLQRLDGPVRGNGKIMQELEAVFHGAGWNVIKVVWGREWDPIFAADEEHRLVRRMTEIVDGQYQRYSVESGDYIRNHLCGDDPDLLKLFEHMTDADIKKLRRGGHDYHKLYAAYKAATEHEGRPTVILAKTVKGWTLGKSAEARNITHQMKKMETDELRTFRDRLELPISDADLEDKPPFHHPGPDSDEVQYMMERRRELGGTLPSRRVQVTVPGLPGDKIYEPFREPGRGGVEVSTTVAFVRLFRELLKDPDIGARLVPIICDEARTFGMEPFFKQVGIYSSKGQLYEPVDHDLLFSYTEKKDGQILEEGLTEAGSMASFIASATSYATHGEITVPFYIFYSMFGFQRVGDQIWSLGDNRGRGFLLGATAGRTTLNGEGLQHEDGHSLLVSSTVPNCVAYDPTYHYEIAAIVKDGLRRMVTEQEDIFYYLTLYNENYEMPEMPEGLADEDVVRGMYQLSAGADGKSHRVRLLGSGPILEHVRVAANMLEEQYDVAADVYSVPSYTELRRRALDVDRWNMLHPGEDEKVSVVTELLPEGGGPVIAASDYMKTLPDLISRWVPGGIVTLGTDGYGMSDTRRALRRHFEMDSAAVVVAALSALCRSGAIEASVVEGAMAELGVDPEQPDPRLR